MEVVVHVVRGFIGIALILAFCFYFSARRRSINWRLIFSGLALQLVVALLVFKVSYSAAVLEAVTRFFIRLLEFSQVGGKFLFGELATNDSYEAIFAFRILPSIVFFSALMSLLYYLGILQRIVYGFAWIMSKTMRLSGAESLAMAANVFIGQTEAPILVRPYMQRMTRSEINCLMTGGMATAAGSVFAGYVLVLAGDNLHLQLEVGKRLMSAFIMAAPGAVVCAKMLYPETAEIDIDLRVSREAIGVNLFDAIARGTSQGLRLAVNVGAIVLVFFAFVALVNYVLSDCLGAWTGMNARIHEATVGNFDGLTLQFVFGIIFAPVAWIIGVESDSVLLVGQLLGMKLVIADFPTYAAFKGMIDGGLLTDERTIVMATYAVCGFAAFVSVGVQVGGLPVLAPSQRDNFARLGIRALTGGFCASLLSATIAGVLYT